MGSIQCQSIDEILGALDHIVDAARVAESPLGYFAALYRRVTREVKKEIESGFFDDGARMEHLDVVFALRYLDAVDAWQKEKSVTSSWEVAFRATEHWRPIVLQHLLLGMNAHINLDLAVAAAEVAPGNEIQSLENDFRKINEILFRFTESVQQKLSLVWPLLTVVNAVTRKADDGLIHFSLQRAREHAWRAAEKLAVLPADQRALEIFRVDRRTTALAQLIQYPGALFTSATLMVRITEKKSARKKIDFLATL